MRRAGFFATTHQGIKTASTAAEKVGRESATYSLRSTQLSIPPLGAKTRSSSPRSPNLRRRPEPEYRSKELARSVGRRNPGPRRSSSSNARRPASHARVRAAARVNAEMRGSTAPTFFDALPDHGIQRCPGHVPRIRLSKVFKRLSVCANESTEQRRKSGYRFSPDGPALASNPSDSLAFRECRERLCTGVGSRDRARFPE